jgi:hypothetical protein
VWLDVEIIVPFKKEGFPWGHFPLVKLSADERANSSINAAHIVAVVEVDFYGSGTLGAQKDFVDVERPFAEGVAVDAAPPPMRYLDPAVECVDQRAHAEARRRREWRKRASNDGIVRRLAVAE